MRNAAPAQDPRREKGGPAKMHIAMASPRLLGADLIASTASTNSPAQSATRDRPGAGPIDRSGLTRPDRRTCGGTRAAEPIVRTGAGLRSGVKPAGARRRRCPHWYRPGPQDGRAVCLSLPGHAGQVDPTVPVGSNRAVRTAVGQMLQNEANFLRNIKGGVRLVSLCLHLPNAGDLVAGGIDQLASKNRGGRATSRKRTINFPVRSAIAGERPFSCRMPGAGDAQEL
ncbi:hypothetical protein GA0061098_1001120 [Bradyrhizobium shewense]|uniref:Uncharacterized protein n=1 Tax=Bradyrhizobium shewense TaxID=1761772 RepID=A0A1C3TYC2_9BRAD|nr:hypothetical protein GA0061098_1001120 [Bradyrhizobium shewense]